MNLKEESVDNADLINDFNRRVSELRSQVNHNEELVVDIVILRSQLAVFEKLRNPQPYVSAYTMREFIKRYPLYFFGELIKELMHTDQCFKY